MKLTEAMKLPRRPLDVEVDWWCVDGASLSESLSGMRKTKAATAHPTLPLVLNADEQQTLSLWDVSLRRIVWSKTLLQLHAEIAAFESPSPSPSPSPSLAAPLSLPHTQAIARSLSRTHLSHNAHTQLTGNLAAYKRFVVAQRESLSLSVSLPKTATQFLGEWRGASFADKAFADEHTHTRTYTYTHNPCESERDRHTHEHCLVFVWESRVVLYDYLRQSVLCVVSSATHLSGKRVSCVEVLSERLMLIGCSDGCVRVWHCESRSVLMTLSVNSAGKEVQFMRVLCVDSDAEAGTQTARLLANSADGVCDVWTLSLTQESLKIVALSETPTARLSHNGKLTSSSVFVDRERQQLCVVTEDRKASIWDLSEIIVAEQRTRTSLMHAPSFQSNKRLSTSTRRTSLFSVSKRTESEDSHKAHSLTTLTPSVRVKLDKSVSQRMSCMVALCHEFFSAASAYAICGKTNTVTIVQNTTHSIAEEESEKASTVAATEKSISLEIIHDLNVATLLNDYCVRHFHAGAAFDGLKVYSVQSVRSRPEQCLLTTSVGPVVLSFTQLPTDNVCTHPLWSNKHLVATDHSLRLSRTLFPHNTVPVHTNALEERETLTDLTHTPHTTISHNNERRTSFSTSSSHNALTQSTVSGSVCVGVWSAPPRLLVSPSGRCVALLWAERCVYSIVSLSHPSSEAAPRLAEIDRGLAVSLAWVGERDHFLALTPRHTLSETTQSRRFSLFRGSGSSHSAASQQGERVAESEFVLRQCVWSDVTQRCDSVCVCSLATHAEVHDSLPPPTHTVSLLSGPVACVNHTTLSHNAPSSQTLSRFYTLHMNGEEDAIMCAISPLSVCVRCVAWDERRGLCAALTVSGAVNVLRLTRPQSAPTQPCVLQAVATLSQCVPTVALRWWEGVLLCEDALCGVWQHYLTADETREEREREKELYWRVESVQGPLLWNA